MRNLLPHHLPRRAAVVALLAACLLAIPAEGREARVRRERPWRVRSVAFSGNTSFSRRILLDRMVSTPSWLLNRVPYAPKVLADDIRVLGSFYRNQGFLQASVAVQDVAADSLRRRVTVAIAIVEGPRTYVGKVACEGSGVVGADELLRSTRTSAGKPLFSTTVEDDGRRMVAECGRRGYLQAAVRPTISVREGGDTADVLFTVTENGASLVGDIRTEGLRKVRPRIAGRELQFSTGDTLTTTAIQKSIDGLYRTGLFKRASVTPLLRDSATGAPVDSTAKSVAVTLAEQPMFDIGAGIGYATEDQIRGSFDIAYRNLFASGKRLGLRGEASFRSQRTELVYTDPRFLTLPARFDLGGHYGHFDEEAYEAIVGGVNAALSFPTRHHVEYRAKLRIENVTYLSESTGEAKPTQSLQAKVTYDTRDDPFAPASGAYASLTGEFAGLGGAETNQFLRGILDLRFHTRWRRRTVISTAAKLGYAHEVLGSSSVPVHERFYAGGNNSIRGFRTRMVGPLDPSASDPKPLGGRLLVELHPLELRTQIYRALHVTLFADCGGVFDEYTEFGFDRMRYSAGGGISLRTAIGVIRAEAGFPLDRQASEPWIWPHIDIGYAF